MRVRFYSEDIGAIAVELDGHTWVMPPHCDETTLVCSKRISSTEKILAYVVIAFTRFCETG
ncbi:hypothetical protein [Pseudorhodobacter sp.]|uniref:hypothetical protein n=1 Tax=Pseudorhodobacter sp. TaxID=1934400 RepID=UPI00264A1481|nr:hypothetical protein [Pseudorhodobacter sp.]MDN5787834.1 hypothetical protein [Pseudorhodobacter sp.]